MGRVSRTTLQATSFTRKRAQDQYLVSRLVDVGNARAEALSIGKTSVSQRDALQLTLGPERHTDDDD